MAVTTNEITAFEQKNLSAFKHLAELTAAKKELEELGRKRQQLHISFE